MQFQDPILEVHASRPSAVASCASCVGMIVEVRPDGTILVDSPRNLAGPDEARWVIGLVDPKQCTVDTQVLLMFDEGTFENPIILGIVANRLPLPTANRLPTANPPAQVAPCGDRVQERAVIEAKDELELRCGASSITLRKDGKLVVKGKNLISRASQTNRIKGGKVAIN